MSTQEHDLERGSATQTYGPGVQQANPLPDSDYPQPPLNTNMQQPSTYQINTSEAVRSYPPRQSMMSPSQMTIMSHQPSGMYNQSDNQILTMFRYHLGIHNDPSLLGPKHQPKSKSGSRSMGDVTGSANAPNGDTAYNSVFHRPAPNVGIYQRVIAAEQKYHKEYKWFALMINGALGLQIIFAAALTALGAANGSHTAVTAFGALNTVLAGLLTFLKGSGLPNRLKYYENEWTKVREHIEQRERDFATDSHRGTLGWEEMTMEIDRIEHMYDNVRKDIEANTPDSYVSMSNAMKSLQSNESSHNNAKSTLTRGLNRLDQSGEKGGQSVHQIGTNLNGRVVSGVSDFQHSISKGFGDIEKQTTIQVREVVDDAHNHIRDTGKQAEHQLSRASSSVSDGYRRAQNSADERLHAIDENVRATQDAAVSRFQNAQHGLNERQHQAESKAKEMESKIMHAGERAAEKFLDFAKGRHH